MLHLQQCGKIPGSKGVVEDAVAAIEAAVAATQASGDADALAAAPGFGRIYAEAKVQALEHATAAAIATQREMTRLAPENEAAEDAVANAQVAVADAQTSGAAADS